MINIAHSRAQVASIDGDIVTMPKAQMNALLDELAIGQQARHALVNIRTMVNLAANRSGATS